MGAVGGHFDEAYLAKDDMMLTHRERGTPWVGERRAEAGEGKRRDKNTQGEREN